MPDLIITWTWASGGQTHPQTLRVPAEEFMAWYAANWPFIVAMNVSKA